MGISSTIHGLLAHLSRPKPAPPIVNARKTPDRLLLPKSDIPRSPVKSPLTNVVETAPPGNSRAPMSDMDIHYAIAKARGDAADEKHQFEDIYIGRHKS